MAQKDKGGLPVCSDRLAILKSRYPQLQRHRQPAPGLAQGPGAERKTSPPALGDAGHQWADTALAEEVHREETPPLRVQTFAAIVTKSAYGEGGLDTAECPQCHRRFVLDRLPIHLAICNKVATNAAIRGVFCRDTQRLPQHITKASGSPSPKATTGRSSCKRKAGPVIADVAPMGELEGRREMKEDVWLRQRSAEVQFTLRTDIHCATALQEVQASVAALCQFTGKLAKVAQEISLSPQEVFQELLARVAEQQDFDSQHGAEGVPMHQAKVLNRKKRLANAQVGAALQSAVGAEALLAMGQQVQQMRRMLKIKVEDKNDLRMASAALQDAQVFFQALEECASSRAVAPYALWEELTL
eukprot:GGOE01045529.1.p1 GENE.GGOE01045529.1~~GGOE01045529.1.p1  ORF type:complete len:404 (-),score=110.29 GGOE01045529.1:558-1631(-)